MSSVQAYCLHAAGEEHDANWGANGRGRKVLAELATDSAAGTVGTAHLTPHDLETGAVLALHGLGAVHVHDLLALVELHVLGVLNTLDLDEGSVALLVGQGPPEASHDALDVETGALLRG